MLRNALRFVLFSALLVLMAPVLRPYVIDMMLWISEPHQGSVTFRAEEKASAPAPVSQGNGRSVGLRADPRGHFEAQASINGRPLDVMIDTGATSVALRFEDALRLGVRPMPSEFSIPIATANGTTKAARVTLAEIRIGDIRVRNVEALVVQERALGVNLLGMSFIRRLSKVEMKGDRLVLSE